MRAIRFVSSVTFIALGLLVTMAAVEAQSGKGSVATRRTVTLNVIVHAPENRVVTRDDFDLYDGGTPQEIESFARLDSGSRIVLMIDSSASLRAELAALQKATEAVVNELYADDQMMVVGYNENAEIITDMTPDLKALQSASAKIIRKGVPNLYDALIAVSDALAAAAKTGLEKRAIILVSDGYDSESKTKFADALRALQDENIVLYALQVSDRTRGALMRDKPKPPAALEQMTAATGGSIFSFDKAEDAAKNIADDLRKNWYRLVYAPAGVTTFEARRLLLMPHDEKINLKTKSLLPSSLHPLR
ncbi:MAG TPA: VWA domain-containing protein [Blastocatellia bacterium]|nr:VWA domain-containing protein [Blastocatellia bacterium]